MKFDILAKRFHKFSLSYFRTVSLFDDLKKLVDKYRNNQQKKQGLGDPFPFGEKQISGNKYGEWNRKK